MDRSELRRLLSQFFDESEIQDICFDLHIDYDNLAGTTKNDKIRAVIIHLDSRGRITELTDVCRKLRPNAFPDPEQSVAKRRLEQFATTLNRASFERAVLIRKQTTNQMMELNYDQQTIRAFDLSLNELVHNGLEHGCRTEQGEIELSVETTPYYVTLTVINEPGVQFNLVELLEQKSVGLRGNPLSRRGRGLLTVYHAADALESTPNKEGVKACFYKDKVTFNIQQLDKLSIIEILSGADNPSITRRLWLAAHKLPSESLIIHVPEDQTTREITGWLDLYTVFNRSGRKLTIFVEYGWGDILNERLLPKAIISHSWNEALQKVGRLDLEETIREMLLKRELSQRYERRRY
jgi:anti-sigma regulatory factor (Ser/Thr protein kinase)